MRPRPTCAKLRRPVSCFSVGELADEPVGQHRQAIAGLTRLASHPVRLPTPGEVLQRVNDLEARIDQDPAAAREELRHYFADGKITLVPQPDAYLARWELLAVALVVETKRPASFSGGGPNPETSGVAGAGFEPATFGL